MSKDKSHFLLRLDPEAKEKYRLWCAGNGITMTAGFNAFMRTVTSKKPYTLQQRILQKKLK